MKESEIYVTIGEDGFASLVKAFYAQVPQSPILGAMYPKDDLEGAAERLKLFLIQRFGGPGTYSLTRGHPMLRARHNPFEIDVAARHEWMRVMTNALDQMKFPAEADAILRKFFSDAATMIINR